MVDCNRCGVCDSADRVDCDHWYVLRCVWIVRVSATIR